MKKYLLSLLVVLSLLSFSAKAQVGFTCDNPIEIVSLPYQVLDGTSNYGNSILGPQAMGCGATPSATNFFSGKDVVYRYTATETGLISIKMTPNGTRSSVFVYGECSDIGGACLAGVANTNANPRIINSFPVVTAEDYYIVISSNATTPTLDYNLLIQYENCEKPTNVSFDQANATLTGGNLSWTENGTATSWEIAVQDAGGGVPTGAGNYVDNDGIPGVTIAGLQIGHLYQYWVRSECSPGVYSAWSGPFVFNTLICEPQDKCTYTFRMTDSANNGWNGARMQIRQNGIVLPNSTGGTTIGGNYNSGAGPVDVTVSMCKDVPFDIFWLAPGTQPQQCIVSVINSFGQTIYTKIAGAGIPGEIVYTQESLNCTIPSCEITPNDVIVSDITVNGATIKWDAPLSENMGFDIFLQLAGTPGPTSSSIPTFSGVNGLASPFSYIIPNGLIPDTEYNVYVRVACTLTAPWSSVVTFKTLEACTKPISPSIHSGSVSTTSATLSWVENGDATQWEVLLLAGPDAPQFPLAIPVVESNDIHLTNLTTTTVSPLLQPATIYYYYVRAVCSEDSKSSWVGPLIFNTITCNAAEKCQYKFLLTSGNSNGWDGAKMEVKQNGIVVATIGTNFTSGLGPITTNIMLCNNVPFELYWNIAGIAPETVGISIRNPFQDIVFAKLPGEGTPLSTLFNSTAMCVPPSCPKPTNLLVNNTLQDSAQLSWTEVGGATQWEVYVVPQGSLAPINGTPLSSSAPYHLADTNTNFTVSGLTSGTKYEYYVRSICSENETSTWTILNLKTFTTRPLNDECLNATVIPVSSTPFLEQVVSGNTLGGTASVEISTCLGIADDDVWFSFIASNTAHVIQLLNVDYSSTGLNFGVYSGDCTAMTQVFCRGTSQNTHFLNNLIVGEEYKIRAYTAGNNVSESISFDIGIITPLDNDDCNGAINVPVNSTPQIISFVSSNIDGATPTPFYTLPQGCGDGFTKDVWFSFVATASKHVICVYDMPNISPYPLYTFIYSGTDCSNLEYVTCGGNKGTSFDSFIIGNTYKVRVLHNVGNITNFKISIVTPLSSYDCQMAINVPVNVTDECEVNVVTINPSTLPPTGNCFGPFGNNVWYSFVASAPSHIIDFGYNSMTHSFGHEVLSGNCNNLTPIYCSTTTRRKNIINNLIPGNTYYIRTFSYNGNAFWSDFRVCVRTPIPITNDEFNTAIVLPVNNSIQDEFKTIGSFVTATTSPLANTCGGEADDDVWFEFIATSTKCTIKLENMQGSSISFVHSLYSGDNYNNLSLLYCSDPDTSLAENLIVGQVYKIRVWSTVASFIETGFYISVSKTYNPLISNTTQFTNEQLVTDILINNPCVDVSNITSSTGSDFGNVKGIGYFTNTSPLFPINSGLILSTGDAALVGGPNTTGLGQEVGSWNLPDQDLEALFLESYNQILGSRNVTKLEFDFTSQNEFMSFNFLFASEEYGAFQCQYADAFAFFLTDLVTGVTENLAIVPGTNDPVSVISIRDNTYNPGCESLNQAFFDGFFHTDFDEALAINSPTNFNGQTALMSASSAIIPNNPYHIKLVIADRQDGQYDSAVFIQAGSFSSGPPQCTDKVNLVAFIDGNNNGTKEDNESSFTYGSFVYQVNNTGAVNNISSPIGNYSIYDANPSNIYDFSYEVHPEYAGYFSAGTISHNNISIAVGSGTQTLYFPITQIQGYNDVTVSIVPIGQPTAGFSYANRIVYKNQGTAATSGTISYTKDPMVTVTSDEVGFLNTTDGFTYNFTNLGPFETHSFDFTINVPSIPVVNIDDVLESSVTVSSPADDINLNNNSFTNSQIVVASYDPNDKMEAHGDKLDFNSFNQDDYLFYTIRFQNTGTANAINIRIEDVLDAQLDEESIRMVSASHNYVMERVGNKLVWKFDYIYLPSHLENEVLSNGYLTFMIKVKSGFQLGDVIPNFAEIYFDTNPAIITNIFTSTFEEQLSAPEFASGNINVYPNPSNRLVYINVQNTNENLNTIKLYDVLGKTVLSSKSLGAKQSTLDVSTLAKGVYMIEIVTDNNLRQTKKLVVN